jgi:septum formation protein
MKKRLILASASPRRSELLKEAGIEFEIIPSSANEVSFDGEPERTVGTNALLKAREVFLRNSDCKVLGADTVVCLGGRVLGKPKDKNEAREMISSLSGTTHKVLTGIALVDESGEKSHVTTTEVTFRALTDSEIEEYISTDEPYDKAGAYGIQERASAFVESINGALDNVIGLPVEDVKKIL